MFKRRSDLPFCDDSAGRFLLATIAVMVFVTTLATASTLIIQGIMERWYRDVSGTLTVQVVPVPGDSPAKTQQRIDAVVTLLHKTPGVVSVQPLNQQQMAQLLEPWLGSTELAANLPVPHLIDVIPLTKRSINIATLLPLLKDITPDISLDDHKAWLANLANLGCRLERLVFSIMMIVAVTTAVVAMHTTRSGLVVHRSVIEILHLMGANDDYIALQFGHMSLIQCIRGGLFGMILAIIVLLMITGWLASHLEGNLLLTLSLRPAQMTIKLGILPIGVAWLAKVSARRTVHRTLARIS
ncbi:Cell division protein FtsX [invertebrate metagenome]|uniref:Cell division protein FtsX n=1 Tax=invertebrate metagenome TaxID=1711999 RepID=A0A484H6L6_9ZZZZ